MYLVYKDLAGLFQDTRGAKDNLVFHTVTDDSRNLLPKGIFVPINEESGELLAAIANGAIAAIWDKEREIPSYTPNQFPIFLTNDPADALLRLLEYYLEKMDGEIDTKMEMTNFNFYNKKLLNKNNETYDIAGILKKLAAKNHTENTERRG